MTPAENVTEHPPRYASVRYHHVKIYVDVDMELMLTGMMHCSNWTVDVDWTIINYWSQLPTVMLPSAAQRHRQDNICGAVFITVGDH